MQLWSLFFGIYCFHNSLTQSEWWGKQPLSYLGATAYLKTLCAIWVISKPASGAAMLSLAVTWLMHLLGCYPKTNNHGFITTVLLLAYLCAWVFQSSAARRSDAARKETAIRIFAPAALLALLALYFNVVWHKLNWDFLSPSTSCAWTMYLETADFLPDGVLPTGPQIARLVIPSVLGAEALIPLLIAVPATRFFGIVAGVLFHSILALHPVVHIEDFSLFVLSCYMLCLPARHLAQLSRRLGWVLFGSTPKGRAWRLAAAAVPFVLAGFAIVAGLYSGDPLTPKGTVFTLSRTVYWSVILTVIVALAHCRLPSALGDGENLELRPILHPVLLAPAFIALLSILPYLGLSTENVLGMFSNIRYEMEPNHILLGSRFKLFDYQREWLALVETNHPELKHEVGQHRPLAGWRRVLAEYPEPELQVAFRSDAGIEWTEQRSRSVHHVFTPLNPLERLLYFRELTAENMSGPMTCRH